MIEIIMKLKKQERRFWHLVVIRKKASEVHSQDEILFRL